MSNFALAGIDPKTKVCDFVGPDTEADMLTIYENGQIGVVVTKETARQIFGEVITDIYAIAAIAKAEGKS